MKIQDYLEKYLSEQEALEHGKQVERLAVMMLDTLGTIFSDLKSCTPNSDLLETAALLHDIGKDLQTELEPHNKIGAKIVLENGIEGFDREQTLIIANLIRYHKGKSPNSKHSVFSKLNVDAQQLVLRFASILRLADALDYNHFSLIEKVEAHLTRSEQVHKLTLKLTPKLTHNSGFEQTFTKKKKLFEEVFGTEVELASY